jgi:PTS system nitrogen regulatory IIA component
MKLNELLREECIRVGSTVDDKAMVLCEIASLAKKSKVLKKVSEDAILEALQERETLGATTVGQGIAIPHCRVKGVRDFVVGLLTVPDGVEFESEDARKVYLLAFIIAPEKSSDTHVRLLSSISQALQDTAVVNKMIEAPDSKVLQSLFLEAAKGDVTDQLPVPRNLVHVFVQDEKVFEDILKNLSTLEGISLSILDGGPCRSYLTRFAPTVDPSVNGQDVSRCIIAIVERSLSNEVIRRVETVTGSLLKCMGVMVAIQELAYSSGSLEM